MPTLPAPVAASLALLLTAAPLAAQSVHVVDASAGPGSDFVDVPDAVVAARDGDVLLVRAGTYSEVLLQGKGLTLVAEAGAAVTVDGSVEIRDTSAAQQVLVSGLTLDPMGLVSGPFILEANVGRIWIQESVASAASMLNTAAAAFVRCDFEAAPSAAGMSSFASKVAVYGCQSQGGFGKAGIIDPKIALPVPGEEGGEGYRATLGSQVFISGSTLVGGQGGTGAEGFGSCSDGGPGGPGLFPGQLTGVRIQDSVLQGGAPGLPGAPECDPGAPGTPIATGPGTTPVTVVGGAARSLVASPRVAREAQSVTVMLDGEANDLALLLFGFEQGHTFVNNLEGTLLLGDFFVLPPVLTLGPDGQTELQLTVPELGAEALVLYLTPFFADVRAEKSLGAPAAVVLLDGAL